MKYVLQIFLLCLAGSPLAAQRQNSTSEQEVLEIIFNERQEDDVDQSETEEIESLLIEPVNIASIRYDDLTAIPFVSPLLAHSIIRLCDSVTITEIEQLRTAELMTPTLFEKIRPFLTINSEKKENVTKNKFPVNGRYRTRGEYKLQRSKGEKGDAFLGDPLAVYHRLSFSSSSVSGGLLFEKDPGERYADGFSGGYLTAEPFLKGEKIVAGRFSFASGEGLVLSHNRSSAKSSSASANAGRRGRVIAPTLSTDEFRYYQGLATSFSAGPFSVAGFYSNRILPASVDSNNTVTGFYSSGLFRTANDISKRFALREKTYGGRIGLSLSDHTSFAVTGLNARYDKQISHSSMRGSSVTAGSISWEHSGEWFTLFGESASHDAVRFSTGSGISIPISGQMSFTYHHRSYKKGYSNSFAHPFGVSERNGGGEFGNYLGCDVRIGTYELNAYIDQYKLEPFNPDFASSGLESMLFLSGPLNSAARISLMGRKKNRYEVTNRQQTNIRLTIDYRVTRQLTLTHRLETVEIMYTNDHRSENGFLTYLNVSYAPRKGDVFLKSRFVVFHTASFDSRIYQFESDVAGNYSNPPLYGQGYRWYLIAGYTFFPNCFASLKYAETKKLNVLSQGSGIDEISGPLDNRMVLQLDFQF